MRLRQIKHVFALTIVFIFQSVIPFPSMAFWPYCIDLFRLQNVRSWQEIESLTFMTFNVANIYELKGKFERVSDEVLRPLSEFPARSKAEQNVMELKRIFSDVSPDIAVLEEVEGLSALERFASELPVAYRSFLLPGNDVRGIDIGFLVKADIPLDVELHTHRHYQYPHPMGKKNITVFTRDLPVLVLRDTSKDKPLMLVFGVHYKSKRDKANDPGSTLIRKAQIEATVEIMKEYQRRYGDDIPMVLAGDFNTDVHLAPEMKSLDWISSAFELAENTTPRASRITHTLHREFVPSVVRLEQDLSDAIYQDHHEVSEESLGEVIDMQQLDDIRLFGFPEGSILSAEVFRYRDELGNIKPFALSYDSRLEQLSDHLPVVVRISTDFLKP